MSSVHDKSLFYTLLRSYSDSCFPLAYHKVEYAGLERIPTDGAVIFAPNHTNALMDALSVSKVSKPPIVYVARADIFRKPLIAKFLNLLKIMPIVRIRDGVSNLKR
ncbi:MAG TPA: 1-acyl-sn-glycerol-3-phosphate acyltransferase, partial [Paludibacteraceae bacterium]|nr:1-acyl-sn-glycerol-3-phosphate acyltransferase [Paludibacteraceae bacterium]